MGRFPCPRRPGRSVQPEYHVLCTMCYVLCAMCYGTAVVWYVPVVVGYLLRYLLLGVWGEEYCPEPAQQAQHGPARPSAHAPGTSYQVLCSQLGELRSWELGAGVLELMVYGKVDREPGPRVATRMDIKEPRCEASLLGAGWGGGGGQGTAWEDFEAGQERSSRP